MGKMQTTIANEYKKHVDFKLFWNLLSNVWRKNEEKQPQTRFSFSPFTSSPVQIAFLFSFTMKIRTAEVDKKNLLFSQCEIIEKSKV